MDFDFSTVRGFNYQPGYGSCSYENWMWFDKKQVRRELTWGKKAFPNMNTIRLWLSYDAYIRAPKAFCGHFEDVLQICDELGILVVATMMNRWHNAFCDNAGIYIEKLLPGSQQYDRWFFREYFEDVCKSHKYDQRILVWDLCNEPFSYDYPYNESKTWVDAEIAWLTDMSDLLKEIGVTQHIGVSMFGSTEREMTIAMEKISTVLMVHPYLQWTPDVRKYAERCKAVLQHLDWQVQFAKEHGKGIFVTECCWGSVDEDVHIDNIDRSLTEYKNRGLGFLAHALCHSKVADLHAPKYGPILQDAGQFNFLDQNGKIRKGLEIFNKF